MRFAAPVRAQPRQLAFLSTHSSGRCASAGGLGFESHSGRKGAAWIHLVADHLTPRSTGQPACMECGSGRPPASKLKNSSASPVACNCSHQTLCLHSSNRPAQAARMHGVRVLSAAPPHTPEQQRGFRRMHSCTRLTGTQSARVASCVKIMGHMPIPVSWHAQEERTSPGRTATWPRAHSEKGPLRCASAGCSHWEPCSRHKHVKPSLKGSKSSAITP